ncbi:MAG: hypothetical protein O9301_04340 [Leptospira sp.]|nr:hypothetical protein [Leptospira sp.]
MQQREKTAATQKNGDKDREPLHSFALSIIVELTTARIEPSCVKAVITAKMEVISDGTNEGLDFKQLPSVF